MEGEEADCPHLLRNAVTKYKPGFCFLLAAGALGVYLHADRIQRMIPVEISFKVLADGGFFIDEEGLSSGESWETVMKRIFQMQQVEGMARIHAKSDEI